MKKRYVEHTIISSEKKDDFGRQLAGVIVDHQNKGLECEIQYSLAGVPLREVGEWEVTVTSALIYSALVLGYRTE